MKYTTDILSEIQTWCHYAVIPVEEIKYGALYNWYAATDVREICSTGWHVSTAIEQGALMHYIDPAGTYINNTAGGHLKEVGLTYWGSPNTSATNTYGFNMRGAGMRTADAGAFTGLKSYGHIWSSTTFLGIYAKASLTYFNSARFFTNYGALSTDQPKAAGFAIRPVKDSTTLSEGEEGTYTDPSGYVYRTIAIGAPGSVQEWVADNIKTEHYRTGDAIPVVTDNGDWAALITGAMCYYNNDISNA